MPDEPAAPASPPSVSCRDMRVDLIWAVTGALLWMLVLLLVPPTVFGGPDFIRYFEPYLGYFRSSLLHGEIPWWNPYASLGRPFVADLQSGFFYPASYLSVLFGLRWGWILATVAHGAMAMLGFIRLTAWCATARPAARAGALVFLFSAPLLARMQAGTVNYAYSWCYLPLGLWLAGRLALAPSRQVWAALSVVWGLQLLSGHPQPFWLSLLAAGTFVTGLLARPPWHVAGRRWARAAAALVAALGCGMALCGVILVPFLELIGQSNRSTPVLAYSAEFTMTTEHWVSLLAPPSGVFFVNWEYSLYAGAIVLLGGLVALMRWHDPVVRGLTLMIGLGILIAVGEATPLFGILFKILPGLSSFRVPARAGALVMFGLLIAATLLAGRAVAPGRRTSLLLVASGLLLGVVTTRFYFHSLPEGVPSVRWLWIQLTQISIAGLAWWLWIRGSSHPRNGIRWGRLLLPAALALELYLGVPDLARLKVDTRDFPAESLVAAAIRARNLDHSSAPVRVCLPPELMRENSGMLRGYATITGFESLSLSRVWNYLHRSAGLDPGYGFNSNPLREVYDRANRMGSLNLSVWLPPDGDSLVITPDGDPRAYLATRVTLVADPTEATNRMVGGHPFHQDALVEAPVDLGPTPSRSAQVATATITRFAINSLDIAVESPTPALLVVAEAWYPGWQAEISGHTIPCIPVNAWMRGVPVPAGSSNVRMSYQQSGLWLGGAISFGAALLLVWAIWSGRGTLGTGSEDRYR